MSSPEKEINATKHFSVWFILVTAFLIRVFFLRFEYAIGWDEVNYLKLGASGAIKGLNCVFHSYWSPLYPLTIAIVGKVFHDYELVGRMLSILFGTLIIIPVYWFSAKYFTRKIAIFSSLLIACFPSLLESSTSALTEPIYTFWVVSGVMLGFSVLKHQSILRAGIVGILFACAYLTRPEGIGLYLVFGGITILVAIFQIITYRKYYSLIILAVVTLAFFGTSAPYLCYLKNFTGKWMLSTKGAANLQGDISAMENKAPDLNPWLLLSTDNTILPDDEIYHTGNYYNNQTDKVQLAGNIISITPFLIIKKYIKNFYQLITTGINSVLSLPILILIGLALWSRPWNLESALRELYLLSFVGFYLFILIPLFHFNERYILPILPIALVWSGSGFYYLVNWFQRTMASLHTALERNYINALALLFAVIFMGSFIFPGLMRIAMRNPYSQEKWSDPIEQKKAGLWLKSHTKPTPVIMAWNHAISFYAGNYNISQSISIPHNDLNRVLAYARHRGAKYLALNEKNKDDFATINYLLDETKAPPELKLIYKDDSVAGLKTVIYEIVR